MIVYLEKLEEKLLNFDLCISSVCVGFNADIILYNNFFSKRKLNGNSIIVMPLKVFVVRSRS